MSNPLELLKARNDNYETLTRSIFEELHFIIRTVGVLVGPTVNKRTEWGDVLFSQDRTMLIMLGHIIFQPGDDIDGLLITEGNAENYRQFLKVAVPIDLVLQKDAAVIESFLRANTNLANIQINPGSSLAIEDDGLSEDDVYEIYEDVELVDVDDISTILDRIEKRCGTGFDYDELSESQKTAILHFTKQHGDKVH